MLLQLQPDRRASSPPGSTRRKPCLCTTAGTPNQLPAGLAPAEAMLLHYSRNAEPAPRRARPGGSHASALQPDRRASSPPGSPRRKPCFCTTAGPPSQLPAGLDPAEAMLLHYSRTAEPAPRRARPGGSRASALQPERRTSSPPGSPRRKPCFCTTAGTPNQLPAGLAPAEAMLLHYSRNAEPAPRRARRLAPAEAMLLHYSRNAEPAPRRARPGGGRIRNG